MSRAKLQSLIAKAISNADTRFFTEDYPKQAAAVLAALDKAGYLVLPNELPQELCEKAADQMKTGRLKPHEHVKDVYDTVLRLLKAQ